MHGTLLQHLRRALATLLPPKHVVISRDDAPVLQKQVSTKDSEGKIEVAWNPDTQPLWCAWCGSKLEPLGHLMARFMMCPKHGEFTWAPVVVWRHGKAYADWQQALFEGRPAGPQPVDDGHWVMVLHDSTEYGMYDNAMAIDQLPPEAHEASPDHPGRPGRTG